MRIISGKFKKTNLYLPKKINFRPTSDFIKEGLFSSIQNIVNDSIFLDLFSGSGSIGLEALSRGANIVYFVDINYSSIKILEKNLKLVDISPENYTITKKDFKKALFYFYNKKIKFDIIFADPPYNKGFLEKIIENVEKLDILKEKGILIIEHSKRENFNSDIKELVLYKILEYGDTRLSFFKRR